MMMLVFFDVMMLLMMTQPERSGSHEEPHKDAVLNLFQNLMGSCLIESAGLYLCLLGDFACLHGLQSRVLNCGLMRIGASDGGY